MERQYLSFDIDGVFEYGLHEFIQELLSQLAGLGQQIETRLQVLRVTLMRLTIRHTTRYQFTEPVTYGLQQLRKTPKTSHNQRVLRWSTMVEGGRKELSFDDHHNNVVELLSFERGDHRAGSDQREGEVEITEAHGVVGRHLGPAPLWLYAQATDRTKAGAGVRALVRDAPGRGDVERLHGLMHLVRDAIAYEVGASEADWTAEQALDAGKGVCQDHSHVFLAAAKEMGLPGPLCLGLPDAERPVSIRRRCMPGPRSMWTGWAGSGFDVANRVASDTRYVRVATGLDYADAAPVTGTRIGGAGEALDVQIEVAQQ